MNEINCESAKVVWNELPNNIRSQTIRLQFHLRNYVVPWRATTFSKTGIHHPVRGSRGASTNSKRPGSTSYQTAGYDSGCGKQEFHPRNFSMQGLTARCHRGTRRRVRGTIRKSCGVVPPCNLLGLRHDPDTVVHVPRICTPKASSPRYRTRGQSRSSSGSDEARLRTGAPAP